MTYDFGHHEYPVRRDLERPEFSKATYLFCSVVYQNPRSECGPDMISLVWRSAIRRGSFFFFIFSTYVCIDKWENNCLRIGLKPCFFELSGYSFLSSSQRIFEQLLCVGHCPPLWGYSRKEQVIKLGLEFTCQWSVLADCSSSIF